MMEADEQRLRLSDWYAEPMSAAAAETLLLQIRDARQTAHRGRGACSACPFHEMIARFWLGRSLEVVYDHLAHQGNDARRRALAELIRGQLMMSTRQRGAMERLRNGFYLAAPYLAASEYFQMLKRHELLAALPLLPRPAAAQGLEALLREARVIRQLQGQAPRAAADRNDLSG